MKKSPKKIVLAKAIARDVLKWLKTKTVVRPTELCYINTDDEAKALQRAAKASEPLRSKHFKSCRACVIGAAAIAALDHLEQTYARESSRELIYFLRPAFHESELKSMERCFERGFLNTKAVEQFQEIYSRPRERMEVIFRQVVRTGTFDPHRLPMKRRTKPAQKS